MQHMELKPHDKWLGGMVSSSQPISNDLGLHGWKCHPNETTDDDYDGYGHYDQP